MYKSTRTNRHGNMIQLNPCTDYYAAVHPFWRRLSSLPLYLSCRLLLSDYNAPLFYLRIDLHLDGRRLSFGYGHVNQIGLPFPFARWRLIRCGAVRDHIGFNEFLPFLSKFHADLCSIYLFSPFACLVYFISASSHNQFSRRRERELGADLPEFRQPKASPSQ